MSTTGMRFQPSDEEAISQYLRPLIRGDGLHRVAADFIHRARLIYARDPKDLAAEFVRVPATHNRFFFTAVRRMSKKEKGPPYRMNREAGQEGSWVTQGRKRDVVSGSGERIGFCEKLFFKRKGCTGSSGWLMEEFHCAEQEAADVAEEKVLCKIYASSGSLPDAVTARQDSAAGDRPQAPSQSQQPVMPMQEPRVAMPMPVIMRAAAVPMPVFAPRMPSSTVPAAAPTRPAQAFPPQLLSRRYTAPRPSPKQLPETIAAEPPRPTPKLVPKRPALTAADPPGGPKRTRPAAGPIATRPAPPPPPSAPLAPAPPYRIPTWCRPPPPGLLTALLPARRSAPKSQTPSATEDENWDDFAKLLEEDSVEEVAENEEAGVDGDDDFAKTLESGLMEPDEETEEEKEMADSKKKLGSLEDLTMLDETVMVEAAFDGLKDIHFGGEEDGGFDPTVPLSEYNLDGIEY